MRSFDEAARQPSELLCQFNCQGQKLKNSNDDSPSFKLFARSVHFLWWFRLLCGIQRYAVLSSCVSATSTSVTRRCAAGPSTPSDRCSSWSFIHGQGQSCKSKQWHPASIILVEASMLFQSLFSQNAVCYWRYLTSVISERVNNSSEPSWIVGCILIAM